MGSFFFTGSSGNTSVATFIFLFFEIFSRSLKFTTLALLKISKQEFCFIRFSSFLSIICLFFVVIELRTYITSDFLNISLRELILQLFSSSNLLGSHGSYARKLFVKGSNKGFNFLARSPKPIKLIVLFCNKLQFMLLSNPYFSLLLIKSICD